MTNIVGQSVARLDARAKVTGEAKYPGDFVMQDMLYGKILFAGRPHARVLSIDTSQAEEVPGVSAIFTAKDVPVNEYGLQTRDQPVLCGPGSDKANGDVVRFVGDQIAFVVAESEQAAVRARDLIQVDYEDLPIVTDPFHALKADAPQLHPDREPNELHPELTTEGNLICHHQIRKGDMESGWEAADVVVEGDYHTPAQEHAFLQPEAGLSYIDDENRVTIVVAGQWTWEDQHQVAHALGIPAEHVRVIYPAIGGAFGGREDMSVQIVLALAAYRLRRPVRVVWNREESIRGHCKRHPMWFHCKWGATREGKLVAADVKVVADGGAYCYTTNKVLGNTTLTCTGPYEFPNVEVDVDGVYTNNPPSGAFRGFGAPQGIFAAEMQMNKLAEALDVDPVALRIKNLLRDETPTTVRSPLPDGVSLVEVTEKCARAVGWQQVGDGSGEALTAWHRPSSKVTSRSRRPREATRSGIGLAVGFKNVGFSFGYQENCWAKIELDGDDRVERATVSVGSADVGQGAHTVIRQMAAEALGVPLDRVHMETSDTATSPGNSGSTSASRTTFMAGNAVRKTAEAVLKRWWEGERPATAEETYLAPETTHFDPETGESLPNFAYGYVAQAVEVVVDVETGELDIRRVVCADDVGQAVNPEQVEGQIEGGVAQAVGWATCEDFITEDGHVRTPHLSTYLIPTVADVPQRVESIIVEEPDSRGPWGARGMGEMPFIPLAPALVAAVHDATGVWIEELPLTPERVLRSLKAEEKLKACGEA